MKACWEDGVCPFLEAFDQNGDKARVPGSEVVKFPKAGNRFVGNMMAELKVLLG